MPPTLLIAFFKDMVFALLSTKASEFFDGWWKEKPVEVAIDHTAEALRSEYNGLGLLLQDWAKRPLVARALAGFARGTPIPDVASALLDELRDCKEFCVNGHEVDFLPQGGRPWPKRTKSISCSISS